MILDKNLFDHKGVKTVNNFYIKENGIVNLILNNIGAK